MNTTKHIRVGGYRIDHIGIHDRFLPWRHYGFWKYAQSVRLDISEKFLKLLFRFEGRKKVLKVDTSNSFKSALKIGQVLELGLQYSNSLVLEPNTARFLEDTLEYRRLQENPTPELHLAKARILLVLSSPKEARKEVDKFINYGGKTEEEARIIRLHSYFQDGDEVLATVEYQTLNEAFPNSQKTKVSWAAWNLSRDKGFADTLAWKVIKESNKQEDQLELKQHLINFLARKREYDESLSIITDLLAEPSSLNSTNKQWLLDAKDEIEKLKTDKQYNRRQTFWQPLRIKAIAYAFYAFIILLFTWPAIQATPKLLNDLQQLEELEEHGILAQSGKFSPETRDMDFGIVRLSYVFSLRGTKPRHPEALIFHTNPGAVVLRRSAANAILKDTYAHSIVYLSDSPRTNTVYPITQENYIGVYAKHADSYLWTFILIGIILFVFLQEMYKKFKYSPQLKSVEAHQETKNPQN